MKKFRGTWILLGLTVALGLYIYFVEIKKAAQDEAQKSASEKVLNLDTSKVKSIEIKNAQGDFQLEKTGDKTWELKSPLKDSADESAISGMLSGLSNEKFDQDIEGEDLKTFGLDKPRITATFTTSDNKTEKLDVGMDSPLPGKVYLQRNDDKKVLFANMVFKTQLNKALKDLRDKRVFKGKKEDVAGLALKYQTKDVHDTMNLVKKGAEWLNPANPEEKIDTDTVTGLLNTIDNLRATDFPSDKGDDKAELKKYDLAKPAMILTLEDKDKKTLGELQVSAKKDNNIYIKVAGQPTIYQTYGGTYEQLLHKPDDFRDRKSPFDFKKDTVDEIQLKTSLVNWHLLKKANSWELALPDPKKQPDQIKIEDFINRVNSFRVSEFPDKEKPKGLNPPEGQIVFKDHGKDVLNLKWGEKTKSGKSVFVKTNKTETVVGVDATSIQTLPTQSLVEEVKPSPTPVPGKIGVTEGTSKPSSAKPPLPSTTGHS